MQRLIDWIKFLKIRYAILQGTHLKHKDEERLKIKKMGKYIPGKCQPKES